MSEENVYTDTPKSHERAVLLTPAHVTRDTAREKTTRDQQAEDLLQNLGGLGRSVEGTGASF